MVKPRCRSTSLQWIARQVTPQQVCISTIGTPANNLRLRSSGTSMLNTVMAKSRRSACTCVAVTRCTPLT